MIWYRMTILRNEVCTMNRIIDLSPYLSAPTPQRNPSWDAFCYRLLTFLEALVTLAIGVCVIVAMLVFCLD